MMVRTSRFSREHLAAFAEPTYDNCMPTASAITVGTFDGVHRGHQHVITELLRVAKERGERSVLVTFDPHPLYIVRPEHAPRLLTTRAEKEALLAPYGIDLVAFVPFTRELSQYEPDRFVDEILIGHFGLAHLIIGYDHGFGRGRTGDVELLRRIGRTRGFEVDVVQPFRDGGDNISSSRIRATLQAGDVGAAAEALGRSFSVTGTVVAGDGRGRQLGMPTANLVVGDPHKLIPLEGIYAVRVVMGGQPVRGGVMHIGPRPTIAGANASLEVHIFDFEGDLYAQNVTVEFHERIRGIEKFPSMEDLAAAMHADASAARQVLSRREPGARGDRLIS